MKFNIKSKLGFTLIELLVVIGILAVLAAIAIPSVAGLIDRANVSADATNANEMTNAIERFTSEYELYLQDIASGRLDTSNLDSAQGRVFNVTGVTDRAGIEGLEKDATAGVDTTGKAIYRDTKYPVNAETMQAVVENYMKTSSTTFTPKQSDCHYYYSPDCGLVVCTETEKSDVTDLNALVQSGKDAKGKDLGATTKWIDLTDSVSLSGGSGSTPIVDALNHSGIIPEGGIYYTNMPSIGEFSVGSGLDTGTPHYAGEAFPEPSAGDTYIYGDYEYRYFANGNPYWFVGGASVNNTGWGVLARTNKSIYGNILNTIADKPITYATSTFENTNISNVVNVPDTVVDISGLYCGSSLQNVTGFVIGENIKGLSGLFAGCSGLNGEIVLNSNSFYGNDIFVEVDLSNIIISGSSTRKNDFAYGNSGTGTPTIK